MVVAFNSEPNSDFGIVLLAPLGEGQTLLATDDGWRTDTIPNRFRDHLHEWHVSHTAVVEEPAGTVLTMADFSGAGGPLRLGRDTLVLGTTPDQLIVYRGGQANPALICALDTSRGYSTSS